MIITLASPEAQIVADGIEAGLLIRKTWHTVNWHSRESNLEMISESFVFFCRETHETQDKENQETKTGKY